MLDIFLVSHKYVALLWAGLLWQDLPLKAGTVTFGGGGVGLIKQRANHPAQQCPLVVITDKLSCWEITSISGILSVYTEGVRSLNPLVKMPLFCILKYNFPLYK